MESLQALVLTLLFGTVVWFARGWKEDVDADRKELNRLRERLSLVEQARANAAHQEQVVTLLGQIVRRLGMDVTNDKVAGATVEALAIRPGKGGNGPEG